MTIKPWKILESHHLHKYVRIDKCELPNGMVIDGFVLEYADWATILALTKQQEVVLIRQYRHGAQKVKSIGPDTKPLEAGVGETE